MISRYLHAQNALKPFNQPYVHPSVLVFFKIKELDILPGLAWDQWLNLVNHCVTVLS